MNIKFIRQQIESHQALGIAFDLGSLYRFTALPLTTGLSIQNIGPQMKFIDEPFSLPLTVVTAIAYRISELNFAVDIKRQIYSNKTIVSFGTEYIPINVLALRAGYLLPIIARHTNELLDFSRSEFTGLSAGIGLNLFGIKTDYSFLPFGELGNTHQITFSMKF